MPLKEFNVYAWLSMYKYPWSKPDIKEIDSLAVSSAVASTWVSGGSEILKLTENLCQFTGSQGAILVNNGTSALSATLLALDLKPGDEVIVPAFGFMAAANVLIQMHAVPIFADVNESSWCLDKKNIEARITKKTQAIVVTHTYGNSDDVGGIAKFAREELEIPLIEDAAEALGSRSNGQALGTFGDFGTFSFHATKLITTGEGGAIVFKNEEFAEKFKLLVSHGLDRKSHYLHLMPGTNFRMPNFCAALGNSQFSRISSFIEARKAIDDLYRHYITSSSIGNLVNFQEHQNNEIVPWSFPIAFKKISPIRLSNIIRILHEKGIETRPGFRTPNFLPYLKHMVDPKLFPVSQKLSTSIISLPAYPYLVEADVELICNSLIEAFETDS